MFKNINKIENKRKKKFFIEKVNLFIKLIKVFAKRNNLVDSLRDSEISNNTVKRLKELEIIESKNELSKLTEVLKRPIYEEFINAINYNLKYQKEIGDLLNNLDPGKRKIIQRKSSKKSCRYSDKY